MLPQTARALAVPAMPPVRDSGASAARAVDGSTSVALSRAFQRIVERQLSEIVAIPHFSLRQYRQVSPTSKVGRPSLTSRWRLHRTSGSGSRYRYSREQEAPRGSAVGLLAPAPGARYLTLKEYREELAA